MAAAPSVAVPNSRGVSHPYTCNTCQVAFKGSELQRGHMQSDWHRYNLKRRVASLPPLTSEIFAEKVLANQASAAATAAKASFEKICGACQRTYYSENAYQNHLGSQKHKIRLASLSNGKHDAETETETASMVSSAFSLGEPVATTNASLEDEEADPVAEAEFAEVVDGIKNTSLEDQDPISGRPSRPGHSTDPTFQLAPSSSSNATPLPSSVASITREPSLACLFCNIRSPDPNENVNHMRKVHGLFIPEQEYLTDLSGLLEYLHERVQFSHECLYCGQRKHTTTGIQTHMRDKGHCMIAFESEEQMIEVGQFYDFTSTYSDDDLDYEDLEENMSPVQQGGVKLGADRATTYAMMEDNGEETIAIDDDNDDDEWESDNGSEVEDKEILDEVDESVQSSEHLSKSTRPRAAYHIDNELHLPSGRTAGHRSLAKYYRQNLHSYPTPAERTTQQQNLLTNGSDGEDDVQAGDSETTPGARGRQIVSRANGGLGMLSAPLGKKREARAIEFKERTRAQRAEDKYRWGNERRANFQKHFRDPLLQ